MSNEKVQAAAENNARWCNAMGQSHGCPCEFIADAWLNRGTPPPYNSNMVTMRGGASASCQQQLIREILATNPGRQFGFKDSFFCIDPFACLDSVAANANRQFTLLFEASWMWLDSARLTPRSVSLRWVRVRTDAELLDFERAWRDDQANVAASAIDRQFPAGLLADTEIAFLVAREPSGRAKAVAIANRTGGVVGLSNVFGPGIDAAELWQGATSAAMQAFPGEIPLVGYERDEDLKHAIALGFEPIGPLRVFVLQADAR